MVARTGRPSSLGLNTGGIMRMRLEPEDDLIHPADGDPNFNESRYYNFFDAAQPASAAGCGWATGPTRATPR